MNNLNKLSENILNLNMRINLIEFFKRDIKDSGCDKGVIKFEKYGLIVGDGFENDIDYC